MLVPAAFSTMDNLLLLWLLVVLALNITFLDVPDTPLVLLDDLLVDTWELVHLVQVLRLVDLWLLLLLVPLLV
jgi:hypothetical protein